MSTNGPFDLPRVTSSFVERFTRTLAPTTFNEVHCIRERKGKRVATSPSFLGGESRTRARRFRRRGATIFISPYCRARCRIADGGEPKEKRERNQGKEGESLSVDDSLRDSPGISFAANVPSSPSAADVLSSRVEPRL